MKQVYRKLFVMAVALLSCSCSAVRTLDSESGLYDVKLERHAKALVDGSWTWGGGNPYASEKAGAIYIAPLDISKVVDAQPELAPLMVPQMHDYVVREVQSAISESNAANGTRWRLADKPEGATIRVDMALVHFRPQRPVMRILSSIGGYFVKVPGVTDVVGRFAEGDICIEMTVRDGKSGKLYLACKDSNAKSASLISADAYSRSGNADANLHFWAKRLAFIVRACAHDKLGDRTLREYISERSWKDVLKDKYLE